MKFLTMSLAAAALAVGMSAASAQHAPSLNKESSPNAINAGVPTAGANSASGSESRAAATGTTAVKIMGKASYCSKQSAGSAVLNCKFASYKACQKVALHGNLECVKNPAFGQARKRVPATTGAR